MNFKNSKMLFKINNKSVYYVPIIIILLFITIIPVAFHNVITPQVTYRMFYLSRLDLGNILKDGRWPAAMDVIRNIPQQPFGAMDLYWAHNLWLDVVRVVGVIPAFFLILFSVSNILLIVKLIISRHLELKTKVFASTMAITLNLSFFLEPVVEGSPQQLMLYVLLIGMASHFMIQQIKMDKFTYKKSVISQILLLPKRVKSKN